MDEQLLEFLINNHGNSHVWPAVVDTGEVKHWSAHIQSTQLS